MLWDMSESEKHDIRPDIVGSDEQGTSGKQSRDDAGNDIVSVELPEGTAYVTPLGVLGVVGFDTDSQTSRPLAHADHAALLHFSGEVRKEAAHR